MKRCNVMLANSKVCWVGPNSKANFTIMKSKDRRKVQIYLFRTSTYIFMIEEQSLWNNSVNKYRKVCFRNLYSDSWPKGMTRRDGYSVCKATHRPLIFDSLLFPKRRAPAFLRQLQRSTDNKPLTNKLC